MGGKIGGKNCEEKLCEKLCENLSEKMGAKTVQCTLYSVLCAVYSVQCTVYIIKCTVYIVQCIVYNVQLSNALKFVEGAQVILSLGSETFSQAPALLHPSRGAVVGDLEME